MISQVASRIRSLVRRSGFDIVRYPAAETPPTDLDEAMLELLRAARPFSLTTSHRLASMLDVVCHVHRANIQGSIVECGVWRGGNMLLAASALQSLGDTSRDLYLYDTFEGMTKPTDIDCDYLGQAAGTLLAQAPRGAGIWCEAGINDVKRTMNGSGYPAERMHFIQGPVEETIPRVIPVAIAVLRLDTDWYESTKHELHHLFPRLVPGGVLIIDDYGHWQGARRAVDEYLLEQDIKALLVRVDYTCRVMVKDK